MLRVRIEGPSSPFPVDKLAAGVARLRAAGCEVDDVHALRGGHAYLNGTDDERRASLEQALSSDVDVVWLARGGYGLTRIVSRLQLPAHAPVLIGFSDATALFSRLSSTSLRCVHGPLATTIGSEPDVTFRHALDVLEGRAAGREWPVTSDHPIDTSGPLFAANLCVLSHLVGTPAMTDLRDKIVVLEEVGERPYRIDRMLTQLIEGGALDGVRAVVVGHLTGCEEPGSPSTDRPPAPRALDVFRERCAAAGVPLAWGLPVGHEAPNAALPLGARARIHRGAFVLLEDLV